MSRRVSYLTGPFQPLREGGVPWLGTDGLAGHGVPREAENTLARACGVTIPWITRIGGLLLHDLAATLGVDLLSTPLLDHDLLALPVVADGTAKDATGKRAQNHCLGAMVLGKTAKRGARQASDCLTFRKAVGKRERLRNGLHLVLIPLWVDNHLLTAGANDDLLTAVIPLMLLHLSEGWCPLRNVTSPFPIPQPWRAGAVHGDALRERSGTE